MARLLSVPVRIAIKKSIDQTLRNLSNGFVHFMPFKIRVPPNPINLVNRILDSLFLLRVPVVSALRCPQEVNASGEI